MNTSVFNLGFRIFFLLAAISAICISTAWGLIYFNYTPLNLQGISASQWHAHEMIYGYSIAVVAGFLLTAVKNWTGINTPTGIRLCILASLWFLARVFLYSGFIVTAAIFDLVFLLTLNVALALPILQSKNYKHTAIIAKVALLFIFNLCFYLGALGYMNNGLTVGIYAGLYLIIGLIIMMTRRLMPFFIEKSMQGSFKVSNSIFLDRASLVLFFTFYLNELTQTHPLTSAYLALGIFFINATRLKLWYAPVIWRKPLLWVLYLSLWFITSGFLLFFLSYFTSISKSIAIHAMAYGGIGIITLGMMARVSLGHTGRDIHKPHVAISMAFIALITGALARSLLPIIAPSLYFWWVAIAMLLWILAFSLFIFIYTPFLIKPRIDGKDG